MVGMAQTWSGGLDKVFAIEGEGSFIRVWSDRVINKWRGKLTDKGLE